MNIKGKHILMRAPELRDLELLHRWANDPEIWPLLAGWHFPYGKLSTEKWLAAIDGHNLRGHVFAIDAPELGLIGTANLVDIDWKNRNAFHGMMLGDRNIRGKGYGLDTVMALMRYAFDELGLERLDGAMIETNERSISFYIKSCGWELEGRKRRWFYRSGNFYDKIVVGITRDRYKEFVVANRYWDQTDRVA